MGDRLDLTLADCNMLLESLSYTKKGFSEYQHYPSHEFKQERIAEVSALIDKIMGEKKRIKENV